MEYFMGGQPAKDRATSGFGIPGQKSLFSDLPQAQPYQAQAYKTQENELQYQQVLHFSPYVSDGAVNLAFSQNIEPVMKGKVPFDQGITNLNNAVNLLLQQGKSQLS
jgi:multiple sugar transport system substrate-binding protein